MATDLTSLLENGVIIPSLEAKSRKQAIHALAEALAAATGLGLREIEDAVMERERLGSTGVDGWRYKRYMNASTDGGARDT